MVAPVEMRCEIFNRQLPPAGGLITMALPEGKMAGGIVLFTQLAATFQLPLPVKV